MLDVPPQRPICTLSGGPKLAQPPLYRAACLVALDELAKVTRGRSGGEVVGHAQWCHGRGVRASPCPARRAQAPSGKPYQAQGMRQKTVTGTPVPSSIVKLATKLRGSPR